MRHGCGGWGGQENTSCKRILGGKVATVALSHPKSAAGDREWGGELGLVPAGSQHRAVPGKTGLGERGEQAQRCLSSAQLSSSVLSLLAETPPRHGEGGLSVEAQNMEIAGLAREGREPGRGGC